MTRRAVPNTMAACDTVEIPVRSSIVLAESDRIVGRRAGDRLLAVGIRPPLDVLDVAVGVRLGGSPFWEWWSTLSEIAVPSVTIRVASHAGTLALLQRKVRDARLLRRMILTRQCNYRVHCRHGYHADGARRSPQQIRRIAAPEGVALFIERESRDHTGGMRKDKRTSD